MAIRPFRHVLASQDDVASALTVRVAQHGPVAVVEVAGDLDMDTTTALVDQAVELLGGGSPALMMLDLAGVRFFGAAGVRALLELRDATGACGAGLVLRNPSPPVLSVLTIAGVTGMFQVETSASGR